MERSNSQDTDSSSAPKAACGPHRLGCSQPQFLPLQNRQRTASFSDDSMWPQVGQVENDIVNSKDLG